MKRRREMALRNWRGVNCRSFGFSSIPIVISSWSQTGEKRVFISRTGDAHLGVVGVGSVDDGGAAEDGDRDADQILLPKRLCVRVIRMAYARVSLQTRAAGVDGQREWVGRGNAKSAAHLSDDEGREKDVRDQGDHAQGGERVRKKVAQLAAVHQAETEQPEFVAQETLVEEGWPSA